ncbi:hypothetical protein MRB53_028775 [Persea americana]|uniref:Uncharacterized protein n=1 Tax=Persea americana TaxID=3435 RepID=A0ACC2KGK0_PERAE|nr:hypothetical protein MRB53_028775 [Persea americana]
MHIQSKTVPHYSWQNSEPSSRNDVQVPETMFSPDTSRYLSSINGRILNQVNVEDQENSGYYLQLLQEHDGVVISSTSLDSDTKALAFNKTSANQPLLIIIATVSDSPLHLPALTAEVALHAIIFADKNVTVDPTTELNLRRWGTEIVVLVQMNLGPILHFCGGQGLYSILIDLKEDSSAYHEILEMGLKEGLFAEGGEGNMATLGWK